MLAPCLSNDALRFPAARRHAAVFLFAIGTSVALLVQSAGAVVLVNDTWKDGTDSDPTSAATPPYAENNGVTGTDADMDGDLESAWFQGGNGSLDPVGANGPLRMQFVDGTVTSSASWTTYFTPEGSEVNLAAAGDKIKVTWAFTLTNVPATNNTSQNFRFGLADQLSGARLTANGSPPSTQWRGYAVWGNMSPTLGNSNPFQLRRRTLDSGNLLNTTSDFGAVLGNGATSGNHGYDAATPYTLTWEITRNAGPNLTGGDSDDGLDHVVKMVGGTDPNDLDNDGEANVTVTDATPVGVDSATAPFGSFKFDTFAVRPSGATTTAQIFDTSLFKVEAFLAAVPAHPGDFNGDGKVDAADYVVWRDSINTPAKYLEWTTNFGFPPGSAAGSVLNAAAVPEPGSALLALAAAIGALRIRRRDRQAN